MTILFRHIKPAQKFRITKRQIARFVTAPTPTWVQVWRWASGEES